MRTFLMAWFLVAMSVASQAITVSRGPYLQMGTHTNIIVRWRTDVASNSQVRFGTNVNDLDLNVDSSVSTTEHEIVVNGLSPDTKYFYSVGTIGTNLAGANTNYFFVTAPLPGAMKATRIWVIGDAGTGTTNQSAVRNAYYDFTGSRHSDLWLMLGDNAYNNGLDSEYQTAVFNMYTALLRKSVVWSTLGNHDTAQSTNFNNSYPYFSMFTFPTNGACGGVASGTEHYYSFDYANIHFICLDSMTANRGTNGAMANWLRADLLATTNDWIIAFWHHPPYTKGSHNSDTEGPLIEMRQRFLPILEDGGVDLVLTGHSHSYERSVLLDGHYGVSTNLLPAMKLNSGSGRESDPKGPYTKSTSLTERQGAVYAVVGSSGQISGGALNHPAMYISLNQLGSMVIDIEGNRLDAKFIRENGTTNDSFTILKKDVRIASSQVLADGTFYLYAADVAAGKTNVVQASTSLTNWTSLWTNVVSSNAFNFTDSNATNLPFRFYRVLRLP